jgi:hypothetical protein
MVFVWMFVCLPLKQRNNVELPKFLRNHPTIFQNGYIILIIHFFRNSVLLWVVVESHAV